MARNLVTSSFTGSTPRRAEHLTPVGQAVRALDCKLTDGTLASWRTPADVRELAEGTRSVYQAFNCCWLESSVCAHWAEGSVEQRHVFVSGYNEYSYPVRLVLDDECNPTVLRLGLPCPAERAVATAATVYSKAAVPRQYVYQFVDSLGNVSAISEPSEPVVVEEGSAVQVSGWAIPAGDWDIQKIRIARSVSGLDSSLKEAENKIEGAWMVVDEIDATLTSYVDAKFDADLFDAAVEDEVEPPPEGLQGMTWIRSMNCLAGFMGRALYFSENNNYHNWAYRIDIDDTVKAITESNGIIYVATDGAPYIVRGESDCANAGCRRAVRMPQSLPLVGSGYRGMAAIPGGAVYATHIGLALLSGDSVPSIITRTHYSEDDWQAMRPDTCKVGYHDGRLFCFLRKGAFMLAIKLGASATGDTEHHTELSLRPDEIFVSRSDRLYLRFGDALREWNRGTTLMPHRYESGHALIGVPMGFGAAQVWMAPGQEQFEVFVDGYPALSETLTTSDNFPLPLWAVGQEIFWVLSGTANVKMVSIAPSSKEL